MQGQNQNARTGPPPPPQGGGGGQPPPRFGGYPGAPAQQEQQVSSSGPPRPPAMYGGGQPMANGVRAPPVGPPQARPQGFGGPPMMRPPPSGSGAPANQGGVRGGYPGAPAQQQQQQASSGPQRPPMMYSGAGRGQPMANGGRAPPVGPPMRRPPPPGSVEQRPPQQITNQGAPGYPGAPPPLARPPPPGAQRMMPPPPSMGGPARGPPPPMFKPPGPAPPGPTPAAPPSSGDPTKAAPKPQAPLHPSANPQKGGASGSRINPAQMPRPKQESRAKKTQVFETRNYNTNTSESQGMANPAMAGLPYDRNILSSSASIPPPPTSSRFVVKDLGNASPRFMRSTFYQVPLTKDLRRTCEMPFAVICQPLAPGDPLDEPNGGRVSLVDASTEGPVRCATCKAYMNPRMRWLDGGRRFQCNMCGAMNDCPPWYFCNLGPNGTRRDQSERPELQYGSVEYKASGQYAVREPKPPACVFLIDCSADAVGAGITHRICEAILRLFEGAGAEGLGLGPGKVAIATFGRSVQFITMNPGATQCSITVVPDVSTPYAPVPASVLLDATAHRQEIAQILKLVMQMHSLSAQGKTGGGYQAQESCAAAAIHSCGQVVQAVGGKVLAFVASLSNVGEGASVTQPGENDGRTRENSSGGSSSSAVLSKLIWPKGDSFVNVAEQLAENQVCVDVFSFSRVAPTHLDIARLRLFSEATGGSFVPYQDFDGSQAQGGDAKRLFHDLQHNLSREQGHEALLRVRASEGLEIEEYRGSFLVRTPTDIDLAGIDADKSIVAYVKHEDKLRENEECCFQCALLYTTSAGERRIRVHTLSLPTTAVLGSVYRSADLDAQMHAILRREVHHFPVRKMEPAQVRDAATAQCVNILYAYRRYCATSSSTGQLILPEALKLMPLYMLAFNKLKPLQAKCAPDARAALVAQVASVSIPNLLPMLFPRLVALHKCAKQARALDRANGHHNHQQGPEGSGSPPVGVGEDLQPDLLSCSSESMEDDACLLLLEENVGYVWIGLGVYPPILDLLFGETTYEMIQRKLDRTLVGFDSLESKDKDCVEDPLCFRVVRALCPGKCVRLKFVARGSMAETKMLSKLIEDRTQSGMSYVEYLCHVHRQIQNKFL